MRIYVFTYSIYMYVMYTHIWKKLFPYWENLLRGLLFTRASFCERAIWNDEHKCFIFIYIYTCYIYFQFVRAQFQARAFQSYIFSVYSCVYIALLFCAYMRTYIYIYERLTKSIEILDKKKSVQKKIKKIHLHV